MSVASCPVSGSAGGRCPASGSERQRTGPRGCSFSGYTQQGDLHAAFDIPHGAKVDDWLRDRERKAINDMLYADIPPVEYTSAVANVDTLVVPDKELLAVALGAPARQVMIRAEAVGPHTGWKDGYLSTEYGFCAPDANASAGALAACPGRVWSDLCERMPGCVGRGRVRESVAALPPLRGTPDVVPDAALWAALVALGMLCSIYRYEEKNDGYDGVSTRAPGSTSPPVPMSDDLGPELEGIPRTIGLPYWEVSRRMGRAIPHLTFFDQASYNIRVRDPTSTWPYVGRFDNTDLRWPMFGERTEIAFLKGCADTSASFQHGPDAIAACQEYVMLRDVEGLLREMVRLKEILERMPNAFHSISTNPNSGDNYVSAMEWVRWGKFSAPLSKRCPAASGLQFPPYLLMDAFLGRRRYDSFLGNEGLHLRAWLPSNLRAFIAAVEYHYRIPEFVKESGDPRLAGVLDGIIEAYTGERGFMGTHRYKVFGILEVASKTGRTETNGNSGGGDGTGRPWEEVHRQFSDAMKERLEPFRGDIQVEPHQMRGSFEECRYRSRVVAREHVDADPDRNIALVTLDLRDTGVTFQPGDRLAVMPLNAWDECAKVAAALGLDQILDRRPRLDKDWSRFSRHMATVSRSPDPSSDNITVLDILRRGHLAPLTQQLVLKVHALLEASSSTVLRVLATTEWPVRGSLGDLLQAAVLDTPVHVWDRAFSLDGDLAWLPDLIPVEVPRTYSISNCADELLPSTVDLTISRAEYDLCDTFAPTDRVVRSGVSSGFLNPPVGSPDDFVAPDGGDRDVLVGISRPIAFQLPIDAAAPCAFFAGGSGIAPFRSFWQARARRPMGRNILYLGVQSRERFAHERELRGLVEQGLMEVHVAFSRDRRGLAYDSISRDFVERDTDPRYIDALIVEQGATVCDLVMSKRQGGLGGHLYICGSVAVFDSVMAGIRRAIFNHRTTSMESTDRIVDAAFAERRIMLDVFMTPRPLPCNQPTIPLSRLAQNTGHRPGDRTWIAVHGSVYDVTDFAPMHPGGTLIIKSNAGVDCSKSFDSLAHTNNPEVASLLTKYFVGHLTPKPDFHGSDDLSSLYDLWSQYLRTTVETLVAQQFEMEDLTHSPTLWFQEGLINMLGVRIFYQYQSRLLQGGFAALFGPKFQELVLRLSFTAANAAASTGVDARLPDILGAVSRATSSAHAVATMKEVSLVGQLICDSEQARLQERGIIDYASRSVALDIGLLEDIRAEACSGMDAFDAVMELDAGSESQRVASMCSFLMQLLERMASRLDIFYAQLSRHSIYQPALEENPARTRWHLVRRRIRDGSLFVMARAATLEQAHRPRMDRDAVDFGGVLSRVQHTLAAPGQQQRQQQQPHLKLNERRMARADVPSDGPPALERFENESAARRMSTFISDNMRAMRRLSTLPPPMPGQQALDFEQIMKAGRDSSLARRGLPTPPSSRASSRSPSRGPPSLSGHGRTPSLAEHLKAAAGLNRRGSSRSEGALRLDTHAHSVAGHHSMSPLGMGRPLARRGDGLGGSSPSAMEPRAKLGARAFSVSSTGGMMQAGGMHSTTSALRSLRLAEMVDRR